MSLMNDLITVFTAVNNTATSAAQGIANAILNNKGDTGGLPPGSTSTFAGGTVPNGWLFCDGSAVSRTTYAALFAAIGTVYGAGDGSTTFNVPNMKDRVAVGAGNLYSLAATGGEANHTLTTPEMPSHNHTITDSGHAHSGTTNTDGAHAHSVNNTTNGDKFNYGQGGGIGGWSVASAANNQGTSVLYASDSTGYGYNPNHAHGFTTSTNGSNIGTLNNGSGGAHNNMQPYIAQNWIIKT